LAKNGFSLRKKTNVFLSVMSKYILTLTTSDLLVSKLTEIDTV